MSFRAVAAAGQNYLALRLPYGLGHYQFEFAYVQRISARPPLSAAWQERLLRRWLVVNEAADSLASPVFALKAAPDCPGYVLASAGPLDKNNCILDASASDDLAGMCLKIPYIYGRDLDDVLIEIHADEEWVRMGGSLFRPAQTVPAFSAGSHSVTIGAEGFAEWRALQAGAAPLQLALSGTTAWRLYGPDFLLLASGTATGQATLSAGTGLAYLMLFGAPNTSVSVEIA